MLLQKIKNNQTLIKNTGYLSIIEIVRLAMPFVALPYIIKTIGAENYGLAIFAQTIIAYFSIFINFGLDISAVKDVSINRNNREELGKIVSAVLSLKAILFIISFSVLLLLLVFVPFLHSHRLLFLYAFLTCLSELLFPVWFYQGIEKMKYITIIRTLTIILYTGSIFLFIHGSQDYAKLVLLQSLSLLIGGFVSVYLLLRVESIRLRWPKRTALVNIFKESIPFFFSRLSVVLNNTMAKTISGIFFSMNMVTAFDLAQKIASVALIPMQMMNQAAYPNIAKTLNKQFVTKFLKLNITISFIVALLVFLLAPIAIHFFAGNQITEAVKLTRILSLWVFAGGMTTYLGAPLLVSFGHSKQFNQSVILSTIILLGFYAVLYIENWFTIYMFAMALVTSELAILIYRWYYCLHFEIINLNGFFRIKAKV